MDVSEIEIIDYRSEHQPWFESFNRQWIEKYFQMEPIDFDVLGNPDEYIIKPGGKILMISVDQEIAGAVALKFVSEGVYEFTKMAVSEKFRGKKIGQTLSEAAIRKAKELGAHKIILYSSTKLAPAVAMYKKLGFVEVPVDGPYKRSDIKMELSLIAAPTYRIRVATEDDAELLLQTGISTFSDSFAAVNTEENMKMFLESSFTIEKIKAEIAEPGSTFMIAYDGNEVAGYLKLRTSHTPDELKNIYALEIERLYATLPYKNKKAGKFLMEQALHYANQHNFDWVWLGVWEFNARAIRFYEKNGFEKFGSHIFLVGTDPQIDFLMKRKLH